ncbi:hypothetical protein [Sulfitobacter alexandrii]|nr:hypothetical protein [Sulfitobacter alexandrii]
MRHGKLRATSSPLPFFLKTFGVIFSLAPMLWRSARNILSLDKIARSEDGPEFFAQLFAWALLFGYFAQSSISAVFLEQISSSEGKLSNSVEFFEAAQNPFWSEVLVLVQTIVVMTICWPAIELWKRKGSQETDPNLYWCILIGLTALGYIFSATLSLITLAFWPDSFSERIDTLLSILIAIVALVILWVNLRRIDPLLPKPWLAAGILIMLTAQVATSFIKAFLPLLFPDLYVLLLLGP